MKDMETLGQFLKREREFRGITLERLANMTRINSGVLKKIEENDFGRTAQAIYVRSFLKSYAGQLGLDAAEVLRRYEGQGGAEPSESLVSPKETPSRYGLWLTVVLIAVSVIFVFTRYTRHY